MMTARLRAVLARPQVSLIKATTLVIHSRRDVMVPYALAEFWVTNIPGSRLRPDNEGGHFHLIHEKRDVTRSATSEIVLDDVHD